MPLRSTSILSFLPTLDGGQVHQVRSTLRRHMRPCSDGCDDEGMLSGVDVEEVRFANASLLDSPCAGNTVATGKPPAFIFKA